MLLCTMCQRCFFQYAPPYSNEESFSYNIARISTDSFNGFCLGPGCYVEMSFRKGRYRKKLNYDFGGI